ncbi:MAG: RDD family protein [Bdellovibrionota bacterium]
MADQFQTAAPLNLNVNATPQVAVEPAGFWRRFLASFIDNIIVAVIQLPLKIPLAIVQTASMTTESGGGMVAYLASMFASTVVYFVVLFFYFGWFYVNKGATPGKMVLDLRVLREDTGTHLSYWRTFGREFVGKVVLGMATLGVGYLLAAFREDKKALHDLAFGSRVVRIRK